MPVPLLVGAAEVGGDALLGTAAVEGTTAAVGTTAVESTAAGTAVAGTDAAAGTSEALAAQRAAQLRKAWDLAKAMAKAGRTTCQECDAKCQQYACGVPGSAYRGGAHWCTQEAGKASHHMPPKAVSPLDPEFGPAIQMNKTDHYFTPSYGRSTQAPYMQSQGAKAMGGDFMGAFDTDAAAVESKYPGKYTGAIVQARLYAQCLKDKGLVK